MGKISDLVSFADGPSLQKFLQGATTADLQSFQSQLHSALTFVDQELATRPATVGIPTPTAASTGKAVPNPDSLPPRAHPDPGKR